MRRAIAASVLVLALAGCGPQRSGEVAAYPTDSDIGPGVYYRTCAEARVEYPNGIRSDQDGYRKALDSDGDGVACE